MSAPGPRARGGALGAGALALLLGWMALGCSGALVLAAGLPWAAALRRGVVCVLAIPGLLALVIGGLSLAKRARRGLPSAAVKALWGLVNAAQFLVPWLGWSALLGALGLDAGAALRGAASVTAFSYLTGALLVACFRPRGAADVTRAEVAVRGLPPEFDGYQILHLSDAHAGPFLSPRALRARLSPARGIECDLVAFTGDLASSGWAVAGAAAACCGEVAARDGAAAVLGNHDNWLGPARVRAALEAEGARVLVNSHMTIHRGRARIHVAGVDDASYTRRDDLGAAFAGIPEGEVVVLLSHTPDIIRERGVTRAALVLAGHTHGGQVVLPGVGPLYVPSRVGRRYAQGMHWIGDGWLVVTRGVGEVSVPVRINCPPELVLVTLRAEERSV